MAFKVMTLTILNLNVVFTFLEFITHLRWSSKVVVEIHQFNIFFIILLKKDLRTTCSISPLARPFSPSSRICRPFCDCFYQHQLLDSMDHYVLYMFRILFVTKLVYCLNPFHLNMGKDSTFLCLQTIFLNNYCLCGLRIVELRPQHNLGLSRNTQKMRILMSLMGL